MSTYTELSPFNRSPNFKAANKFCSSFFSGLCNWNDKTARVLNDKRGQYFDIPILYRERSLYGLTAIALSKCCGAVFSEYPCTRKDKGQIKTGRVEFWVKYNENEFYIEIKRDFLLLDRENTDVTRVRKNIEEAKSQVESIRRDLEETDFLTSKTSFIGLTFLVTSSFSDDRDKLPKRARPAKEIFENDVAHVLPRTPEYVGYWSCPQKWQRRPVEWCADDRPTKFEFNPYVFFIISARL